MSRSRFCTFAFAMLLALFVQTAQSQNITLVGESDPFPVSHRYGDVWAEGDIVCVGAFTKYTANPSYGVAIFSITNPAAPVLLANYNPNPVGNNQFEHGAVRDGIGYFANWSGTNGGLHVVSLTNPASPVTLATIGRVTGTVTNGFDRVHTMFLDGNFVYLADHLTPVVKVFNVSNPSLPVFVRNITTTDPQRVHQITVVNNRLFTSGWGGKTDIYDVSNVGTQAPPLLGSIHSGGNSHSSWPTPDGKYLVNCRETAGGDVRIYDISDPANAVLVSTLTTGSVGIEPAIPHNPVVIGNLLYISWYQAGLQVFDISDPARPVRVGSYDTFSNAISTSFEGNWGVFPFLGMDKILLSDMQRGLLIVDATPILTNSNNYPPLLLAQPSSQTVTQGMSLTFSADATGSAPLQFQWRLNGNDIPGATSNVLTIHGVQPNQAGSYSVRVSNGGGTITSATANLTVIVPQVFHTLFQDDFDTDSSANWLVFAGSGSGADHTVDWAFDYSSYFSVYNNATIPPAPNSSNGITRGLKLTVNNNDATGAAAGVSLYPANQVFSNAFTLKFDMWMNYPGGPGGTGSTGSTETATFGINHAGTRVNWDSSTSNPSDGHWFGVHGEGGGTGDYRVYVGNPSGRPTYLAFSASGLAASGASTSENSDPVFQSIFPSGTYETPGSPGKRWVEVEISQTTNNVITWKMNGNLIAQRTNTSAFTNGTIMLGYMDLFASIANPAADAFVIFDNVRVETLAPAVAPSIVSQPQSLFVLPEHPASFSVSVVGSAPLSYQWFFNGAQIHGATQSSFTRHETEPEHEGEYSVIVSNIAGAVTSAVATLTLLDAPEISNVQAFPGRSTALITWETTIPANSQVEYDIHEHQPHHREGSKTVIAAGHGKYNTYSDLGTNLVLQHSVLLTGLEHHTHYGFQVISRENGNEYRSAGYHFETTHTIYPAPTISGHPVSQTNAPGTTATFHVTASGVPYVLYQWKKNGTDLVDGGNVSGAQRSVLVLENVSPADAGSYSVVVSNEDGSATSLAATLVVAVAPEITAQPVDQLGTIGGSATFTVHAVGTGPLAYQWRFNGQPIANATQSTLELSNLHLSLGGDYQVIVSNSAGYVTSMVARLSIHLPANPFMEAAGVYNGLFYETNAVRHHSSGYLTMKVKTNAGFSGKMLLDGNSVSFSGKFAADGTTNRTVLRTKFAKTPVTVALQVDFGADKVVGTVSSSNWVANLLADRVLFSNTNLATNFSGKYTLLISGAEDEQVAPAGFSYGALTVRTNAKMNLSGFLADRHPAKQATFVSGQGNWPLYAQAYVENSIVQTATGLRTNKEFQGSVIGWLTLTNGGTAASPQGYVQWTKTGWTNQLYAGGFTNEAEVVGSLYVPPAKGNRVLQITNGAVTFSAGGLSDPVTRSFIWATNNAFQTTSRSNLSLSVNASSGVLKGSFAHPQTGLAVPFHGAVLQNENRAGGFFLGTNSAGLLLLQGDQ
ncbi:MAG: immunoglobulin domain-containing protein [Limisphaerales bacterium]